MTGKRCLVAMSGGVDSSVTAALMQQAGYDCVGATMWLCTSIDRGTSNPGEADTTVATAPNAAEAPSPLCTGQCDQIDIDDARRACWKLGIPHRTVELEREFSRRVIAPFIEAYCSGRTPNPCIPCNTYLKASALQAWARQKGFDCLATGHYARTHDGKLYKAKDLRKDQSYVLYSLSSEQLSYMRLPLGSYTKDEVRATAAGLGLANAQKEESQDICFVPDGNYAGFIETQAPLRGYTVPQPGRITRSDGSVVGAHDGIHHFTIGQRRGLGIAGPQPFYVLDIDAATDTVIVGTEAERGRHVAYVNEVNLMCPELFTSGMSLTVKHRYRGREHEARVYAQGGDTLRIVFSKAQRDLTKGQALVLYDGDLVVGGGTIKGTEQAPWHSRDAQDAQAVRDAQGVQDAKNAQDAQDAQDAAGVN